MHSILIIFLLVAIFTIRMPLKSGIYKPFLFAGVHLLVFSWLLIRLPLVSESAPIIQLFKWIPELGLNLDFQLDGLSLIFALLVSGIPLVLIQYHSTAV